MEKMKMKFSEFIDLQEAKEGNLYLWGDITSTTHNKYKKLYSLDKKEIIEEENEPHMTFIWLGGVKGMNEGQIYETIKPILKGKTFTLSTEKFEIFKDCKIHGKNSNCLVIRLKPSKALIDTRKQVIKELKKFGCKFQEIHPIYKPHMTMVYFKKDADIDFEKIKPETIKIKEIKFQFQDNEKKRFV